VVRQIYPKFFDGNFAVYQSIRREGLSQDAYAIIGALYTFPALQARQDMPGWKQSDLFAATEILSEWHGINPTLHNYYMKDFAKFIDTEAGSETYTYGERWKLDHQLHNVIGRLKKNIDSRQAVMVIYSAEDTHLSHWNVPCTLTHQFVHRDGKMDVCVSMRSQDFTKGMKYDTLLASFLDQAVATATGTEPGRVRFFVGNLHLYAADVLPPRKETARVTLKYEFDIGLKSFEEIEHEMELLRLTEYALRTEGRAACLSFKSPLLLGWENIIMSYWEKRLEQEQPQ
jgi:thymidylate synthase